MISSPKTAIYPGSFDPLTNGHLDLIVRGRQLFPRLVVAVLHHSQKQALFSVSERVDMLVAEVKHLPGVSVDSFEGLLVNFADQVDAPVLLRGLRSVSDYEFEWPVAQINRRMRPHLETVFLPSSETNSSISSRQVKEIASLSGDVSSLVPAAVAQRLKQKFVTR